MKTRTTPVAVLPVRKTGVLQLLLPHQCSSLNLFLRAEPSRCRKLHNIVNSVVVLDEVQLLPPEFLNPILKVIQELRKYYGVTFLLSTATQPALNPQKSLDFNFKGLTGMKEYN